MHGPRYRLLGVFFVLGTVVMLIPFHFPVYEAFLERLLDPMHIVFFGGVTWLLTVGNPLGIVGHRPRLVCAMLLAAGVAATVEIIQPLTGRQESFEDLRDGIFGILLVGSAMWLPFARRSRAFVAAWSAAALFLVVIGLQPAWQEARGLIWRARHFPVLADFESTDEMRLWDSSGLNPSPQMDTAMSRRPEHPSHGTYSLIVQTAPGPWPGVRLICDDQDWTGYATLAFDIFNGDIPFDFALRIDDDDAQGGHDTRFNRALPLQRGWNRFRIPLTEVEHGPRARTLHMNAIRRVVFFRDHPREGHVVWLDYVRLEH
jgi:hypothetical protein